MRFFSFARLRTFASTGTSPEPTTGTSPEPITNSIIMTDEDSHKIIVSGTDGFSPPMTLEKAFKVLDKVSEFLSSLQDGGMMFGISSTALRNLYEEFEEAKSFIQTHVEVQGSKIADIERRLVKEINARSALEKKVGELESEIGGMKNRIDVLELNNKLLLVRQLAYSYQSKLAIFVRASSSKLSRTHEQISKMKSIDNARFGDVEKLFLAKEYVDTQDIDNGVKLIRELGTSLSHPSTHLDGEILSKDDMLKIISDLYNAKKIDEMCRMVAVDILEVIDSICKTEGFPDRNILLSSK